jgi:hypothetical protein
MDGVDALSHLRDAVAARPPLPPVTGRGAGMIAAAIILPVVVSIWTGLRIWTRRIRELSIFFTEDILCYLGLVRIPLSCSNLTRPPSNQKARSLTGLWQSIMFAVCYFFLFC